MTKSTTELTFSWLLTSLSNLNNVMCAYSVRLLVSLLVRILHKIDKELQLFKR